MKYGRSGNPLPISMPAPLHVILMLIACVYLVCGIFMLLSSGSMIGMYTQMDEVSSDLFDLVSRYDENSARIETGSGNANLNQTVGAKEVYQTDKPYQFAGRKRPRGKKTDTIFADERGGMFGKAKRPIFDCHVHARIGAGFGHLVLSSGSMIGMYTQMDEMSGVFFLDVSHA